MALDAGSATINEGSHAPIGLETRMKDASVTTSKYIIDTFQMFYQLHVLQIQYRLIFYDPKYFFHQK